MIASLTNVSIHAPFLQSRNWVVAAVHLEFSVTKVLTNELFVRTLCVGYWILEGEFQVFSHTFSGVLVYEFTSDGFKATLGRFGANSS